MRLKHPLLPLWSRFTREQSNSQRDSYSSRLPGPHSTSGPSQLPTNPIIPDVCGELPWSWVSVPCRGEIWCTSSSNHFSFPASALNNSDSVCPMYKCGSDFCSIQTPLLRYCLLSLYLVGQDLPSSDLLAISYSEQAEQPKSLEVSGTVRGGFSILCYATPCSHCLQVNQVQKQKGKGCSVLDCS